MGYLKHAEHLEKKRIFFLGHPISSWSLQRRNMISIIRESRTQTVFYSFFILSLSLSPWIIIIHYYSWMRKKHGGIKWGENCTLNFCFPRCLLVHIVWRNKDLKRFVRLSLCFCSFPFSHVFQMRFRFCRENQNFWMTSFIRPSKLLFSGKRSNRFERLTHGFAHVLYRLRLSWGMFFVSLVTDVWGDFDQPWRRTHTKFTTKFPKHVFYENLNHPRICCCCPRLLFLDLVRS